MISEPRGLDQNTLEDQDFASTLENLRGGSGARIGPVEVEAPRGRGARGGGRGRPSAAGTGRGARGGHARGAANGQSSLCCAILCEILSLSLLLSLASLSFLSLSISSFSLSLSSLSLSLLSLSLSLSL